MRAPTPITQVIGTKREYPTKTAALKAAQALTVPMADPITGLTVNALIESYRAEKMPKRIDTRRAYEVWLSNQASHINICQPFPMTVLMASVASGVKEMTNVLFRSWPETAGRLASPSYPSNRQCICVSTNRLTNHSLPIVGYPIPFLKLDSTGLQLSLSKRQALLCPSPS